MTLAGAAPAHLGRYELLARLATGGMGEIFLARLQGAAGFEKIFAIKRILPHLAGDPYFREMLTVEAHLASLMAHGNICHVYELGETDGQLYLVMEYLEGITMLPLLRKLSKDGAALELGFVAGVIQQATEALHYAHELKDTTGDLGIVHRDVTPSNIFLTESGAVKLLDFGIAKVRKASLRTQTGTVKGKYAYMAPEQLRGGALDRRADVFALGVVVWEMLALRRLFQRKTDYLTFRAVMEDPILDVRRLRPDCPAPLASTLARALDRDPDQRFETARQFGSAVLSAISAVQRPWTHDEIGDLIRGQFAHDIHKRRVQIASAVHGGLARQTMPLISLPDEETLEVEDGPEFAPVESPEEPPVVDRPRAPSGEHIAQRQSGAHGVHVDMRGVQPVGAQPQPAPRRSVLWPLVAFAMLGVAGGALYLVWRAPPSFVLTSDSRTRVIKKTDNEVLIEPNRGEPDPADPPNDGGDTRKTVPSSGVRPPRVATTLRGSGADAAKVAEGKPSRPPPPPDRAMQKAVEGMKGACTQCEKQHGIAPPGTTVEVVLASDGRAKSVAITPEEVDAALGECLAAAVRTVAFPHGADDRPVAIKLTRQAEQNRSVSSGRSL